MNRREFLTYSSLFLAGSAIRLRGEGVSNFFDSVMEKALAENRELYTIDDNIKWFGLKMLGIPYKGGTLDITGDENCIVNFNGLDCVTFFENVLCLARIIAKGKNTEQDLLNEVTFTRYREGRLDGYLSRLHYTADWIYDNVRKGVVRDVTPVIGGNEKKFNVDFMSANPHYYPKLSRQPESIAKLKEIEADINNRTYFWIPKALVSKHTAQIQTGDIICFTTSIEGLDYSHIGIAYRQSGLVLSMLHASTDKKKVIIEEDLVKYINSVKKHTGITVLRPLEPEQ